MTKTAQKLIEALQKLPEEKQDEVAATLLEQLKALRKTDVQPLTEMIGAGTGLYESPGKVDDEIRKQREGWGY